MLEISEVKFNKEAFEPIIDIKYETTIVFHRDIISNLLTATNNPIDEWIEIIAEEFKQELIKNLKPKMELL